MQLHKIHLQNFRSYVDQTVVLGNHRVQIFLAPNGGGKTALIDACASLLGQVLIGLGMDEHVQTASLQHRDVHSTWLRHGNGFTTAVDYPCSVRAEGTLEGKPLNWVRTLSLSSSTFNEKKKQAGELMEALADLSSRLKTGASLPLVARYGTGRFSSSPTASTPETESPLPTADTNWLNEALASRKPVSRLDGYRDALSSRPVWEPTRIWWVIEEATAALRREEETAALKAVKRAVLTVLGLLEQPRFDLDAADVLVAAKGSTHFIPVSQLSDGYRVVLALAIDLARRTCLLNPHLGTDAPEQTTGVVLIDELDLHLHPSWQREVIRHLSKAFPLLQFIVTTHAPEIVVGAGADGADVHVIEPDANGLPKARRVDYPAGHSVDDLLTGAWFKLTSAVDRETVKLIQEYADLYRKVQKGSTPELEKMLEVIRKTLRERLDSSLFSSVETLVMDVIVAIEAQHGPRLSSMSWNELQDVRQRAVEALNKALP